METWTQIHHVDQDIIQLILHDAIEGEESIWVTFEQMAALKAYLNKQSPHDVQGIKSPISA